MGHDDILCKNSLTYFFAKRRIYIFYMFHLWCQFAPVGIFVISKNGTRQSVRHVYPHLVLHTCACKKTGKVVLKLVGEKKHATSAEVMWSNR